MPTSAAGKMLLWLIFAMAHYGLTQLIVPVTMAVTKQAAGTPEGPGLAATLLVRVTKLLHFPLVTLAVYPREWFPGDWVHVPIVLNSLIWAGGIYGLVRMFQKTREPVS
jgi:hypothetical protein